MTLRLAQTDAANELLSTNSFALLAGMLLDQQFPMERAFTGPALLAERLGTLDPAVIATLPDATLHAAAAGPPAIHRYPKAMADRIKQLAIIVTDRYGGDAAALWRDAADGAELLARVRALPGFGEQKSRILVALLGKQLGVCPPGWRDACAPYGEPGSVRSVADVVDADTLGQVRAFKQAAKRAPVRRDG